MVKIQSGTKSRLQLFSDGIIRGRIGNGIIQGVICSSVDWGDPFKSNAPESIVYEEDIPKLKLITFPGWGSIGYFAIWHGLLIVMAYKLVYSDLMMVLGFIGLSVTFAFLPNGLGKILTIVTEIV